MSQMHNQELYEDAAAPQVAGSGDILPNSEQPLNHGDSKNDEFYQVSLLHISHTNIQTYLD